MATLVITAVSATIQMPGFKSRRQFDDIRSILENGFKISDSTGQTVIAKPGDVCYIPEDSRFVITTESTGLSFCNGQRGEGGV